MNDGPHYHPPFTLQQLWKGFFGRRRERAGQRLCELAPAARLPEAGITQHKARFFMELCHRTDLTYPCQLKWEKGWTKFCIAIPNREGAGHMPQPERSQIRWEKGLTTFCMAIPNKEGAGNVVSQCWCALGYGPNRGWALYNKSSDLKMFLCVPISIIVCHIGAKVLSNFIM